MHTHTFSTYTLYGDDSSASRPGRLILMESEEFHIPSRQGMSQVISTRSYTSVSRKNKFHNYSTKWIKNAEHLAIAKHTIPQNGGHINFPIRVSL
jgi:hypothetical protein